ncbi:MAG: class I SAM-dependent RNA methyltransferase [Candidatus Saccharimonadales bacterium]
MSRSRFKPQTYEVTIDKLIHGGQGVGTLTDGTADGKTDGKKALVWNVLPGEHVRFTTRKAKSSYVEGIAEEILKPSTEREVPRDELYLSTSPWQMMTYAAENRYKQEILAETIARAGVTYAAEPGFTAPKDPWHYRNKMEYSLYGDDDGLHLALFNRGTHGKRQVTGSSIARPEVDATAQAIRDVLRAANVRAGDLKSLIVRCNEAGECVAALFTRDQKFQVVKELEGLCRGIVVVYSDPKSPASVRTQDLYKFGDISLSDMLLEAAIRYDVFSFFQGNLGIFRTALKEIQAAAGDTPVIDMYSGVGSIGLSLPQTDILVESEAANVVWAKKNTGTPWTATVVHASSERALDHIDDKHTLIVDPPRAGLHHKLINHITEVKPPKIIYLSCNPATFARDLQLLQTSYTIKSLNGYNFFPRTPHIEALAVLTIKST